MEDAPTPYIINNYEKEIKDIQFLNQTFNSKLNNENYTINIGILKDILVIKVINEAQNNNIYQSHFTFEQLKNISKSMRYFDDINDIVSFIENKGKQNEILIKKEQNDLFVNFKVASPNGKEEDILLKLNPKEINNKELISILLKKVDNLEKEIKILKERINTSENIISKNKVDISNLSLSSLP